MYATYMRLEKRPGCRLLSPLPERPIQASNNDCSNTAAYLYTFYQKFKPDSKNPMPASPRLSFPRPPPRHSRAPHPNPPRRRGPTPPPRHPAPPRHTPRPHPNPPRRRGPRPKTTSAPPSYPAPPPESPAEGGGPRRPQDDQAPRSPHPSFRPPPVIPANAGIQTSDCIQPPYRHTPPNPPRRRGPTPPPTERPLGPPAWRLRPVELLPADAEVSADTLDRSCGQIPIGVSGNGGLTVIGGIYPDLV